MSQGRVNGMLKVLIADDEKMICSLISQLLDWNALGYEIVGMAYTGVDAYEMIRKEQPDVIISDIRMPGYDGIELIKSVKYKNFCTLGSFIDSDNIFLTHDPNLFLRVI